MDQYYFKTTSLIKSWCLLNDDWTLNFTVCAKKCRRSVWVVVRLLCCLLCVRHLVCQIPDTGKPKCFHSQEHLQFLKLRHSSSATFARLLAGYHARMVIVLPSALRSALQRLTKIKFTFWQRKTIVWNHHMSTKKWGHFCHGDTAKLPIRYIRDKFESVWKISLHNNGRQRFCGGRRGHCWDWKAHFHREPCTASPVWLPRVPIKQWQSV